MLSWALKYKGKNKSLICLGGNRYVLYEVTSKYNPSLGYSKSIQSFIGVITEENGLVLKKKRDNNESNYLEYDLSHFLYLNFKRSIPRSLGRTTDVVYVDHIIKLIIVKYIFDGADEDMTYLCIDDGKEIKEFRRKISDVRINDGSKKLNEFLRQKITDENDLNLLKNYLRLITVRKDEEVNIYGTLRNLLVPLVNNFNKCN